MEQLELHVGDEVEVDLPGYKHHGKRGVILRLKSHHGIDYADVRLYNHKRSIEFLAVDLKLVNATQLEIDGLQSSWKIALLSHAVF